MVHRRERPYLDRMTTRIARLDSRAPIRVSGPDARPFLHNLLTQDVETLAEGDLRAGEVLSGRDGAAIALLRLDRLQGALTVDGRPVTVRRPEWLDA